MEDMLSRGYIENSLKIKIQKLRKALVLLFINFLFNLDLNKRSTVDSRSLDVRLYDTEDESTPFIYFIL